MMRRLILRRGLTALLGGAAALASGKPTGVSPYYSNSPPTVAGNDPSSSGESQARSLWAEIFYKQRRAVEREQQIRYRSYNETDPYLSVLLSTSPVWRASVMYDRHKQRQAITEAIQDRIDAIWQEPFTKLQTVIGSWIRGDA